jgi:hypothetical protein
MNYIEWKSDSSEEEDFQMVINKRSKKEKKETKTTCKKSQREGDSTFRWVIHF